MFGVTVRNSSGADFLNFFLNLCASIASPAVCLIYLGEILHFWSHLEEQSVNV